VKARSKTVIIMFGTGRPPPIVRFNLNTKHTGMRNKAPDDD